MKELSCILCFLPFAFNSHCQGIDIAHIDSIVISQDKLPGTYQYDYSALENNGSLYTRFELVADTAAKRLLKAVYIEEGKNAIIVYYYFHNNKLVKAEVMTRDEINKFPQAAYYFFNDKLITKKGKNITLQNERLFKKISPLYILKQQDYWIQQFQYFINN